MNCEQKKPATRHRNCPTTVVKHYWRKDRVSRTFARNLRQFVKTQVVRAIILAYYPRKLALASIARQSTQIVPPSRHSSLFFRYLNIRRADIVFIINCVMNVNDFYCFNFWEMRSWHQKKKKIISVIFIIKIRGSYQESVFGIIMYFRPCYDYRRNYQPILMKLGRWQTKH